MGAIRILQEQPPKPPVKEEGAQTIRIPPPPPTPPPSRTHRSDSLVSSSPRDPKLIQPNTHVYAVWFDDDGLVYEVC